MNPGGRRAGGLLLAAVVTAGIAALSRAPYSPGAGSVALLRLSWGIRGERVEECRRLSEEELAAMPIHMRRSEVCEGRMLPYHLKVTVDGRTVAIDTVRAGGAREDRPIYVFRELPLEPGRHRIRVEFVRESAASVVEAAPANDDDEGERRISPAPSRLELIRSLELRPGDVALVTYDPDRRELVTRLPDGEEEEVEEQREIAEDREGGRP